MLTPTSLTCTGRAQITDYALARAPVTRSGKDKQGGRPGVVTRSTPTRTGVAMRDGKSLFVPIPQLNQ